MPPMRKSEGARDTGVRRTHVNLGTSRHQGHPAANRAPERKAMGIPSGEWQPFGLPVRKSAEAPASRARCLQACSACPPAGCAGWIQPLI